MSPPTAKSDSDHPGREWVGLVSAGPGFYTPGPATFLWRWGRVELPVQGLRADRVYERSRRFFVSRNEARTDTLLVLARSVYLSPPTDRSAGRSSAYIALPGPRSGDREDVSLTRQRERKKCWQLSACRSD